MTFSTDPPPRQRFTFSQKREDLDRLCRTIGDPQAATLGGTGSLDTATYRPVTEEWLRKYAKALAEALGEPQQVDGMYGPQQGHFVARWIDQLSLEVCLWGLMEDLPVKWIGRCSYYETYRRRQAGKSIYRDAPSYTGDVA